MKSLLVTAVLLLPAIDAHAGMQACDFESDYSLKIGADALHFLRASGEPKELRFAGGRLYVDGREQPLSAADRERVQRFEANARALIPEVKALAFDGIALAAEALGQVAIAFGGSTGDRVAARIDDLQSELRDGIERELDNGEWDEARFERDIERLVGEIAPMLAGEIAAAAVSAGLSGDEAAIKEIERRAKTFEQTMEKEIEARAELIEQRAERLCPQVAELHALQDGLLLADGRPLGLMRR